MDILESIIPIGKDNAIHQNELAERLGVTPTAAKKMVHDSRRNGVPILSGICGYWIAENEQEVQGFIRQMRKQAISRLQSVKLIENALDSFNGQISLSDVLTEDTERQKKEE